MSQHALRQTQNFNGQIPDVYMRKWKDQNGNNRLQLFSLGDSDNLQVVVCSTGAETTFGFSTTVVYAKPPRFALTVGDNDVSEMNPVPSQIDSPVLTKDWFVNNTLGGTQVIRHALSANSIETWAMTAQTRLISQLIIIDGTTSDSVACWWTTEGDTRYYSGGESKEWAWGLIKKATTTSIPIFNWKILGSGITRVRFEFDWITDSTLP